MRLSGKVKCFGDDIHFFAVARRTVAVQQSLERVVNQFVVSGFLPHLLFVHSLFSPL
jgi:hypothetical protein